jgi:putative transcriptional regulator
MAKSNITDKSRQESGFLHGHLLIAMPGMKDPRFEKAVIYMCAHSADGAMGVIINHRMGGIEFADLAEQLDVKGEGAGAELAPDIGESPVYMGGPVETSRGFVLHSKDYYIADATLPIRDGVCLTASIDILRAIAAGEGPEKFFLSLGYSGWAPGQLEHEIAMNGWLHCRANMDIVFNVPDERKYERALAMLGIDPGFLASDAGHA